MMVGLLIASVVLAMFGLDVFIGLFTVVVFLALLIADVNGDL